MSKNIAIFGGTFDPIHKGHILVAELAIKELNLDKLIFVPTYKSPFKKKGNKYNRTHNFNMIEKILIDKSEISDFEIKRKGTSYTIDTIKFFKNKYKDSNLFLLIGTDHTNRLHKWKDIEEISELCQIVTFNRKGKIFKENFKKYNCIKIHNEIWDYSSSNYKKGYISIVDDRVQKYIVDNFLYLDEILWSFTNNAKLNKHCKSTGALAAQYAKLLNIDAKKGYMAGLLHDLTKSWTITQHHSFLTYMGYNPLEYKDHQLHSLTASLWLEKEFKMDDKEFTDSIKKHTNLDNELTNLDKVVFMADKLCEGRKWEGIQKIREEAFTNFEDTFKKVVAINYEIVKNKNNGIIESEFDEVFKKWM